MSEQNTTRNELEARIIAKAWQDEAYKQELLSNPKAAFSEELGQSLPDEIEIRVIEENPTTLYLVLPMKPVVENGEELSEEQLEAVAGGWCGGLIKEIAKTIYNGIKNC
jgi:hypothetical protein